MSQYVLAGYLLLVGIVGLVKTEIPTWVVGVSAVATALALVFDKAKAK